MATADMSPGAPHDEFLSYHSIDEEGRIALQIWFDVEDIEAALAELDALHTRSMRHVHEPHWKTPHPGSTHASYALFAAARLAESERLSPTTPAMTADGW